MTVEIDGSILEGGGQILRSTIAFSAVLQEPVIVKKIRAKRSNPGLRPQHLHGVLALQKLTNAQVKGTHVGSQEISFSPQTRKGGELTINIGTAGAITLILQAVMIVAPFCKQPVSARIIGGTNVAWSPPIDYLQNVMLPRLLQMNYSGIIKLEQRGYYPRGGGRVHAQFFPIDLLTSLDLIPTKNSPWIKGISHCGSLPKHVVTRQAQSATNILTNSGHQHIDIKIEHNPQTLCPGSGISLWTSNDPNQIIGSDALGRRGVKAEEVGELAAKALLDELKSQAPVDFHQADMLIPYIALAKGRSSFSVSRLTLHTLTNIHVIEQFLNVKFQVQGELDSPAKIIVDGTALEGSSTSPESSSSV